MSVLRGLAAAFSYFSILPIRSSEGAPDDSAIALLPIVGVVIGALAGYGAYGVALLTHSQLAAAIAAWVLSIALSGAIHVDGFLDCCDGLFAMAPPEKRLEIMRDPHHGTYAIVGMAIISVLWLYALAQIPPPMMPAVLAIAGFLARALTLTLRPSSRVPALFYLTLSLAVIASVHGRVLGISPAVALAAAIMALVAVFARRRLGGVLNGDCYGATIVVSEVALLLSYPLVTLR